MGYTVNGLDTSAEGMEPIRMQSEVILLASVSADTEIMEARQQWIDDLNYLSGWGDDFDYDAAETAIKEWTDENSELVAQKLAELSNPDFVDEDGSATFRIYLDTGG